MPSDPVNTILREGYYDQQLLRVDDFQREQDFNVRTRAIQNQLLIQHGVLSGLVVVATASPPGIGILPGIALDAAGQIILLADVATLNGGALATSDGVFAIPMQSPVWYTIGQPRRWRLSMEFAEAPVPGAQNRIRQVPALTASIVTQPAPTDELVLAEFTVTATSRPGATADAPPVVTVSVTVDDRVARVATVRPLRIPPLDAGILATGTLDVARLPAIPAASLAGTIAPDQLPPIPAATLTGTVEPGRLPPLPALTGTLTPEQLPVEVLTGTIDPARLPPIPAASLTGTIEAARLPPLQDLAGTVAPAQLPPELTTGTIDPARLPPISAASLTGTIEAARLPPLQDLTGTVAPAQLPPELTTGTIDPARLPPISAASLTGTIEAARLPPLQDLTGTVTPQQLPPGLATGTIDLARLPPIPATSLTGTLDVGRLPLLQAMAGTVTPQQLPSGLMTGTIDPARLPPIPVTSLIGTIDPARLPPLQAMTGTIALRQLPPGLAPGPIDPANLPPIPAAKLTGTIDPARLPPIPAASLTGTIARSALPGLDAAQIVSGIIDPARLPAAGGERYVLLPPGFPAAAVKIAAVGPPTGGRPFLYQMTTAAETQDQDQSRHDGGGGAADNWQSFTAGLTGLMTRLQVMVSSGLGTGQAQTGSIRFYQGEGTGGPLLSEQPFTFQPVLTSFQTCSIAAPFPVVDGQRYTFRISIPILRVGWVNTGPAGFYPRGTASLRNTALVFRTFVLH